MSRDFIILTDTRQQKENHINRKFDKQGILHIRTGLPSADYMALRYIDGEGFKLDYSVLIDTKKDILELCGNLTKGHQRLVNEVEKGHLLGCKDFVFLIGDSKIKTPADIINWQSDRTQVKGEMLLKIMQTFKEHHDCRFIIVPKSEMGERIIDLLNK